jgi:hypothetical protein
MRNQPVKKGGKKMQTHEGAMTYEHSMNHAVEFFSKAGSAFSKKGSFYSAEYSALDLFINSWIVDKPLTFKLLLWLRDCRGGAGNRSGSRACMSWLAKNDPEWLKANILWVPKVGRWDDLRVLFKTPLENIAAHTWASAISNKDQLAAKWADRSDYPIRKLFELSIGDFRRMLAGIREDGIVEHKMCSSQWENIIYNHVPSVAMSRYTNAFKKHDLERFNEFKQSLKKGETKIHADVLFPHDCVRTARNGDTEIADAQFDALPNLIPVDENIMPIADTSGSMIADIAGSITAMDVSMGLALYCSAKMPSDSPFYKRFIEFCSESRLTDWRNFTFSQAVHHFNNAVGSTRIDTALQLILRIALEKKIPQKYMPTTLMIISDMQFSEGAKTSDHIVETELKKFEENGYQKPKVLYWNLSQYKGSCATELMKNVGLISGFSPSLLKSVFAGEDFSPRAIMLRTLEKYSDIEIPINLNKLPQKICSNNEVLPYILQRRTGNFNEI